MKRKGARFHDISFIYEKNDLSSLEINFALFSKSLLLHSLILSPGDQIKTNPGKKIPGV